MTTASPDCFCAEMSVQWIHQDQDQDHQDTSRPRSRSRSGWDQGRGAYWRMTYIQLTSDHRFVGWTLKAVIDHDFV